MGSRSSGRCFKVTIKRNSVLDTQFLIGFLGVTASVKERIHFADVGIN